MLASGLVKALAVALETLHQFEAVTFPDAARSFEVPRQSPAISWAGLGYCVV
jgi:hypothetical protein